MKCLYISDLDGTLLNKNQEISKKTASIINKLLADGLLFTIATARSYVSARPLIEKLAITLPIILMNGVMVYDPKDGRMLDIHAFEPAAADAVIKVFEQGGRAPYVYFYQDGLHLRYKKVYLEQTAAFFNERKDSYRSLAQCETFASDRPVVFINMLDRFEILHPIFEIIRAMPSVRCAFYPDNYEQGLWFLEVFSENADKGLAAKRLQSTVRARRLVTFGDNFNDAAMLKAADIGIAVENAPEEIKKIADFCIGPHDDDAVAGALQLLCGVYGI